MDDADADAAADAAALMLLSLTHVEVDQKTAQDMEKTRNEVIRQVKSQRPCLPLAPMHAMKSHRPCLPPVPSVASSIGKCKSQRPCLPPAPMHAMKSHRPWLPPVPSVAPFIGKCSKPIEKKLKGSDVKNNQARLSLKRDSVIKEFLPLLNRSYENVRNGIQVIAYDSYGNKYEEMKFILWADKMFVLAKQWKQFSQDYKLVSNNDAVKVWMFRDNQTDKLSVVITPILDHSLSLAERDIRRMWLNRKTS